MTDYLTLILPLVAGLLILLVVIHRISSRIRDRLAGEVRRRFAGRQIVRQSIGANFFGLTSRGMGQVRGNGALVLTTEELYFVLAVPRREITIPLESITSVTTPRSHLGKTVAIRLLRVDFRTNGVEDAVAWAVNGVNDWKAAIERYSPARAR